MHLSNLMAKYLYREKWGNILTHELNQHASQCMYKMKIDDFKQN